MKVISHRGYWRSVKEKNTFAAFDASFVLGYGIETDIRDCLGRLVISHDMPRGDEESLSNLLEKAVTFSHASPLTIAINVKSDGLAQAVSECLRHYPRLDCFVFDMAVPDMRSYFDLEVPVFTRLSDIEKEPVWFEKATGVWIDAFYSDWAYEREIHEILQKGKRVCVVSPELHGRPHVDVWERLLPISKEDNVLLCTDLPENAERYFNTQGAGK
jgi:glycerophosphoryl diester phosphodiesterase